MPVTIESLQRSPFYSRAYGGFTHGQNEFYLGLLGSPLEKTILDPMAGQAFSLSPLASQGATVHIGDINPSPLVLSILRSPQVLEEHKHLVSWLQYIIDKLQKKRRKADPMERVEGWLAPSIEADLQEYAELTGLACGASPFNYSNRFWTLPIEKRFAAGVAMLVARRITTFRTSCNITWLRPGGLLRETRIAPALRGALKEWQDFAGTELAALTAQRQLGGYLLSSRMDITRNLFGSCQRADAIITSPPYANRLDYTRMWAPESQVLRALFPDGDIDEIQRDQVGSVVVKGLSYTGCASEMLPDCVQGPLREIREDDAPDSSNYYYPFFLNYAQSLSRGLRNMADIVSPGGLFVVFVRDTVRRDVLFPTGELVASVLGDNGFVRCEVKRIVIKHHIGRVRRGSAQGIHGAAQFEWWMGFRKGG